MGTSLHKNEKASPPVWESKLDDEAALALPRRTHWPKADPYHVDALEDDNVEDDCHDQFHDGNHNNDGDGDRNDLMVGDTTLASMKDTADKSIHAAFDRAKLAPERLRELYANLTGLGAARREVALLLEYRQWLNEAVRPTQ